MVDRSSSVSLQDDLGGDVNSLNPLPVKAITGFCLPEYDSINLGYTAGNITSVVYKMNGNVVFALALAYAGGDLVSVERV